MLDRDHAVLIGTYTDPDVLAHQPHAPTPGTGIHHVTLTAAGRLVAGGTTAVQNPAVLIPDRRTGSVYAVCETITEEGTVRHYRVGADGALTAGQDYRADGRSTCYLAMAPAGDAAIVINYWDAMIEVAEVAPDGALGPRLQSFRQHHRAPGEWRQVVDREDHWGNRQVGPHAHCAHFWRDWVFIPDLGENAVFQYRWDAATTKLVPETHIPFEAGSGPRHLVIHPHLDVCYVSNELFNTVCAARLDGDDPDAVTPRLVPFQYESTIEDRAQTSYVSEIALSPDARFLYVSNRGDDSLAVFAVGDDGRLGRVELVSTGGRFPRHFAISPCGRAVVVANQDSGTLRVLARDLDSGRLTMTDEELDVPAPNYVRFLDGDLATGR
ncbi:MAG: lactonase family protein [Actinomycetota bacterium]